MSIEKLERAKHLMEGDLERANAWNQEKSEWLPIWH